MYARVWNVHIQPGKIEEFKSAMDSLVPAAHKESGFRGVLALRSGSDKSPEATVIGVWNSLEELKASEKSLFLYQAISRVLCHCEGFPNISEQEVMLGDLVEK